MSGYGEVAKQFGGQPAAPTAAPSPDYSNNQQIKAPACLDLPSSEATGPRKSKGCSRPIGYRRHIRRERQPSRLGNRRRDARHG
jgi:hypothetical protein